MSIIYFGCKLFNFHPVVRNSNGSCHACDVVVRVKNVTQTVLNTRTHKFYFVIFICLCSQWNKTNAQFLKANPIQPKIKRLEYTLGREHNTITPIGVVEFGLSEGTRQEQHSWICFFVIFSSIISIEVYFLIPIWMNFNFNSQSYPLEAIFCLVIPF